MRHIQISWPLTFAGMPGPFPLLIFNAADAEGHKVRAIVITTIMIEGAREAGATHMWAVWEAVCSVLQPEDTLENTFWGLYS